MGRKEVQRGELLEAFWRLIERPTPSPINVQTLVREAGCYRGTFYYHFSSIEDFLECVIEQLLDIETARVVMAVVSNNIPHNQLAVVVSGIEPRLNRLGKLLNTQVGLQLQPKISALMLGYWHELLGVEVAEGTPRRGIAEFAIGGAFAMWAWRARQPQPISVQELARPEVVEAISHLLSAAFEAGTVALPPSGAV